MDIMMVSEYADDIFTYMKKLERDTMPDPKYIDMHPDLAWRMRGVLLDWMIDVHDKFQLLPETLYLAINLVDRFLSIKVCNVSKLQLVGITALLIASKYEEILAPTVENFTRMIDEKHSENDVKKAERYMLKSLSWNLSFPNPLNWLRRLSKADRYNIQTRTMAKYLMEVAALDERCLGYGGSRIAAAAIYIARIVYEEGGWTPNMAHYANYSKQDLQPVVKVILDSVSGPIRYESLFRKYGAKRNLKSSIKMKAWVDDSFQRSELGHFYRSVTASSQGRR
eukprot:TRINITY_DN57592_c0_g1_i1.p1 TRINITY_DN57592_c0_g1~~TRINITY_DN57592_c0_g1_i1.p1  ORF type:complete len:288 (-),score=31.87 TRINITY_DN57592_c0_g1_i1:140-982(-)